MNIHNAIIEGTEFLKKNNIRDPELDCELLMANVLRKERDYVILNLNESINENHLSHYNDLIKQRSYGKPIAYLIKKKASGIQNL